MKDLGENHKKAKGFREGNSLSILPESHLIWEWIRRGWVDNIVIGCDSG